MSNHHTTTKKILHQYVFKFELGLNTNKHMFVKNRWRHIVKLKEQIELTIQLLPVFYPILYNHLIGAITFMKQLTTYKWFLLVVALFATTFTYAQKYTGFNRNRRINSSANI